MGEERAMGVFVSVFCLQYKENGLPSPKGLNSIFQKRLRKGIENIVHQSFTEIYVLHQQLLCGKRDLNSSLKFLLEWL